MPKHVIFVGKLLVEVSAAQGGESNICSKNVNLGYVRT